MNFLSAFLFLKRKYDLLVLKKYTTLSGTLVFFFIMSVIPLTFWLTLFLGKLPIDTELLLNLPVFDSVKNVLTYIQAEARNATAGASVFLLVTTLYSSTNFFYQMRRSGEIIYGFSQKKAGLKVRLSALLLFFFIILLIMIAFALFALCMYLVSRLIPLKIGKIADYLLLLSLAFVFVLLLNVYVCPYKKPVGGFIPGTLWTVFAWSFAVIGFSVYLQWSNMDRLYGTLSTIIVFLLWLYVLMLGFVSGVILNSEHNQKGEDKKF